MSLSYTNLPVYVGHTYATSVSETDGYVIATKVDVSYTTSPTPRKLLGEDISTAAAADKYKFGAPLSADISFSCVLQKFSEEAFQWLDYPHSFVPIQIGTNIYQKCYPTDVSVSIAPYVPVTLDASFICLDPAIDQQISGDASPYGGGSIPLNADQLIYGHTCSVENMGNVVGDVQSQINYRKNHSRSPIYTLGSVNATSMILNSVEEEMTITSTGLNNLINFSGDLLSSSVKVILNQQNDQHIDYLMDVSMDAGARVAVERYGVGGGDTVQTTATIKQVTV
tara:strand:- start:10931 stop:11776 length:846 start_codon:yes stop_codon:yes gene_type:complete